MKKVFVYGILQSGHSGKSFNIKDDYILGNAILDNFQRRSVSHISRKNNSTVKGELLNVPDRLEQELFDFEKSFGYVRENVEVKCKNKNHNAIVYIYKDRYR